MGMQTADYNEEESFDARTVDNLCADRWRSGMQVEGNKCAGPARQRHESISGLPAHRLKGLLCTEPCKGCPAANGKQRRSDPHRGPTAPASNKESRPLR